MDTSDLGRDPRFREVERYYLERLRTRGDVYGWGAMATGLQPIARILADPLATEIPDRIGGIAIVVTRVTPPEPLL